MELKIKQDTGGIPMIGKHVHIQLPNTSAVPFVDQLDWLGEVISKTALLLDRTEPSGSDNSTAGNPNI